MCLEKLKTERWMLRRWMQRNWMEELRLYVYDADEYFPYGL